MRSYKYLSFETGTTDVVETVVVPDGGEIGLYSVYARKIGGAGSATLKVEGSFVSDPGANDLLEVQSATSVGTGALTNILGASEETVFPYLTLTLDRTGSCAVDVYVTVM